MKKRITKRILSLVMTLLMLLSSVAMLFAYAETQTAVACADHPYATTAGETCATCGHILPYKVDFTGATGGTITQASGYYEPNYFERTADTVRMTRCNINNKDRQLGIKYTKEQFPIYGHKYEVEFWVLNNAVAYSQAFNLFYDGANVWKWAKDSRYSSVFVWQNGSRNKYTIAGVATGEKEYIKVTIDGTTSTNNVTTAVKVDGEYVDKHTFSVTFTENAYFWPYLHALSAFNQNTENPTTECSAGDVVIREVCVDKSGDNDHNCDYCDVPMVGYKCTDKENDGDHNCDDCNEPISDAKCYDANNDGNHLCDDCGVPMVDYKCTDKGNDGDHKCDDCNEPISDAECFDANDDGDHKCDDCGKENITECKNDEDPHTCDTDIKCTYFRYCRDNNDDTKCDLCGKDISNCVDEKINDTGEAGKDHLCDDCGKPGLGTHSDSSTDNDHVCEECGKVMEGEVCKDESPIDHKCDVCLKPIGKLVNFDTDGAYQVSHRANAKLTPVRSEGSFKVMGSDGGISALGVKTEYPIANHKYEITYTLSMDKWCNQIIMTFVKASSYKVVNASGGSGSYTSSPAGETGWHYVNETNRIGTGHIGGNNSNCYHGFGAHIAKTEYELLNAGKYTKDFKVIVDGFANTMTLYVVNGTVETLVSTINFTAADPNLRIGLASYGAFLDGGNVELSNVTIYEGCADENKDHKCDYCEANINEHVVDLGKHDCNYCEKAVTECTEGKKVDHVCDICFKVMPSLHKDDDKDHFCDLCGDARMSYCLDENGDNACDLCGKSTVHDETDVDKDHKCDVCGTNVGEHIIEAGKHVCDYCGIGNDKIIDFSAKKAADQNASGLYVVKLEDGVRLKGLKNRGIATAVGIQMSADEYPLLGHQYEVFFYLSMSNIQQRVGFSVVKDNDGKSLGWITMENNTNQLKRLWDNIVLTDSISAERDCSENNRQYFKVLVDGIGHKIAIYVMLDGEYVKVDEIEHIFDANDYFMLRLFCDARLRSSEYVEMRGVTVRSLCEDVNVKNHLCDICGADVGICYDINTADGDHNCDICGKPSVNSVCSNFNNDHKCDTDSACVAYLGCNDGNGDHRCDANYCTTLFGDHVDKNKDHFCDGCPNIRIGGFCVDENEDDLCDYCEKSHEETDNTGDHKCDLCDAEIPHYEGEVIDHRCDLCGVEMPELHEDKDPADHFCDECGDLRTTVCGVDENGDKKCDVCGVFTEHEHVDEKINSTLKTGRDHLCDICWLDDIVPHADSDDDTDLVCDHCGEAMNKTVVDFSSIPDGGVIDYTESGIRIDGVGMGNYTSDALSLNSSDYPMVGHRYEINYWLDSNTVARAAFSLIAGAPDSDGNGGRLGWTFRGSSYLTECRWHNSGTSKQAFNTVPRDLVDNRQHFKVILDGVNVTDGYGTLSLYVLSGGEYKLADQRKIKYNESSRFHFVLFCYDNIYFGEHMEIGGLTISQIE